MGKKSGERGGIEGGRQRERGKRREGEGLEEEGNLLHEAEGCTSVQQEAKNIL